MRMIVSAAFALLTTACFGFVGPASAQIAQRPLQIRPVPLPTPRPLPISCVGTPTTLADGVYTLRLQNGKSLDSIDGGSFTDGAAVQAWDFASSPNQRWIVTATDPGHFILRSAATAKSVSTGLLCGARAGCTIMTMRSLRAGNQVWYAEQTSPGLLRIRLASGGMQLTIGGDFGANGARAATGAVGCGASQLFRAERIGDYREVSRADGLGRLMSIDVHLNNYTPIAHQFDASGEHAYFRPHAANVGFAFGGRTFGPFQIDLPVIEVGPDRMYKVYVNDWNSRSTTLNSDGHGHIRAVVNFEDDGVEVITNCYNNFNCFVGEPRFDMTNSRVTVVIQPRFDAGAGGFTFDATTAFDATISETGPCVNNFFAFICDLAVPDRAGILRDSVVNAINNNLTGGVGRAGLEGVLNSLAGGGSFHNVTVGDGGELIFY
jgi:hypothetical protein